MAPLPPRGVVALLALVAAASIHSVASSAVPGDQYPTAGLTLGGFTYTVNVTSYANTSADARDIIRATPLFGSDFGAFADATAIYSLGKNSFRNQAASPKVYRIANTTIQRNYTLGDPLIIEAWYELAAVKFFPDLNRFYLDKYISDPLAGINEFAAGATLAPVREPIADASILFYPVLYFYHEIDAAFNALKRVALNFSVAANLDAARDETDDAIGCILAPNAINGNPNQRMAPGYNPWDVSNRLGAFFCTCASGMGSEAEIAGSHHNNHPHKDQQHSDKGSEVSRSNVRFLALANQIQALFANDAVPTPQAFGAIRQEMQRTLNINQIQLSLESAYLAYTSPVLHSCISQFQRAATLDDHCTVITNGAASWAYWRMAMPALYDELETDVYKAKLLAVADLLHPTAWARITDAGHLKVHFGQIVDGIKEVTREAGINWHHIATCKI